MAIRKRIGLIVTTVFLFSMSANADELGNINFPNSGSAEAQIAFRTGVKALHSFQFDEARFAFEAAQEIDPNFALAYWGQAMSDNHPLWAQQDVPAASAALQRLAPSFEGRLAKAPTEKEKSYLTAIETLYFSADDKLQRDIAYSEYMADMHERWPDDDEISIFYALSLLGTVRPGDRGYRRQAQAAAISLEVFKTNPNHPGAAHFTIHSFDDPDHAILALPAAKVYAGIAPAAAHALHMPSHIFLQLGLWERVVKSNIDAYAAAVAGNKKYGLAEGREDFHTLSWLAYANLMLGHYDQAEENLSWADAAVKRNPGNMRVASGYLDMRGRHILESGQWQNIELAAPDTAEGSHAHWVATVGMNAAHRGEIERAMAAEERLSSLRVAAAAENKTYDSRQIEILESEVKALRLLESDRPDEAISVAKHAAEMEMRYMSAPSGPPKPMKPAAELYASVLLAAGKPAEAVLAFEQSLAWIPRRTPSMLGLAEAAKQVGDEAKARKMLAQLSDMPGANPNGPASRAAAELSGSSGH